MSSISFREKELAAVKINAADVDIIANELEVRFLLIIANLLLSALISQMLNIFSLS